MNNREEWSRTEQEMQKILDDVREEYPNFWADEPALPKTCNAGMKLYEAEKARKRRRRNMIAACFVVCILGSTALTIFVNSDTAHAMKFALEKKYYEVTGMVSATDSNIVDEKDSIAVTITDESQIKDCKKLWDGVTTFGYIPDGYQFKKLEITKYLNGIAVASYLYEKNSGTCFNVDIRSSNEEQNNVLWMTSKKVRNGECEYREWADEIAGTKGIDVLLPGKVIVVRGQLDEDELINIVNGMN